MPRWRLPLLMAVVLAASGNARAADLDGDGLDDAQETSLADAYAPYLYFHPEETYFPTTIQFALDHSVLERYNSSGPPILVDPTPTSAELAAFNVSADPQVNPGDVYYLNNTLGDVRDDGRILSAYRSGTYPKTAYVHVAPDAGLTVIQYWFFYPFNPGPWNNHEGDWEMVEVLLAGTSPTEVAYSQHESGARMAWADVSREGNHPRVYVARGSHANYLRPHEGLIGITGDTVSDAGPVWRPSDYTLVHVGERARPSQGNEWLRFAGRWGAFSLPAEARSESGPGGPGYRQGERMFTTPVQWAASLSEPHSFVLLLAWFLANVVTIVGLLLALFAGLKLVRLWRLHRATKAGLKMWPYAHLLPFDRKSASLLVALVGLLVGLAGFLLPWYAMTVDVNAPGFLVTNGPEEFLRVDGVVGATLNPMKPGGGAVRVSVLPLPIGILLLLTTAYFFLRIAGTTTSRRLGSRFVAKGIVALLPFVVVVLIASFFVASLPGEAPGGIPVRDLLRPIADRPFGGTTSIAVDGNTGTLAWGLGIGAWLLIASAILLFVAGGLSLSQSYSFLPQWYVAGFKSSEDAAAGAAGVAPPPPSPESAEPSEWPMAPPAEESPPPPPVPEGHPLDSRFCGHCGAPLDPSATVCGRCGKPVG